MGSIDSKTEEIIFRAARKVFTRKGFDGARMQEIADEAGINKALLHYYFRNKDKLFDRVFRDVVKSTLPQLIGIMNSDMPLFDKIRTFTSTYIDILSGNPEFAGFVFHELSRNPYRLLESLKESGPNLRVLENQIKEAALSGKIEYIPVTHLVVNMMSLIALPFIAQPVIMGMFSMNPEDFDAFIRERKELVPQTIIHSIIKRP
ncbi:MAG TPA: TetR/AcrR family transcriptional regulator [Lentimicrobium sp.]|jgi:AcrR family transcriptional regulator|nr:TetR/AcrR family transcriptional regulator [Lentimicrobium sp.]